MAAAAKRTRTAGQRKWEVMTLSFPSSPTPLRSSGKTRTEEPGLRADPRQALHCWTASAWRSLLQGGFPMFRPRTPLLVCLLLVFSVLPVLAQAGGGRIVGIVRDATGVPVVGATVTVTNQDTGAVRVVRTSATGAYEVGGLNA